MLEAEVFEYDDTVGRKIGMAIDYSNINGDFALGVKTVFGEGISNLMPQIIGNYTNEEKKKILLTSLALQDRNGGVKILSEPSLVLKPGKKALLKLNTEKYVIVSGVNDSKLEKIETGIVFSITPIILSKSTILLKLHLEQSEFIPTNEAQIVQSSNKNLIDTSVVVNDGELISLGGIYLSKQSKFNSGIPILKDIPGIGYVFKSDSHDSSRTMIEFMIRPTIKKLNSRLRTIKQNTYRMFFQEYH
jgi:type III secretion protein C